MLGSKLLLGICELTFPASVIHDKPVHFREPSKLSGISLSHITVQHSFMPVLLSVRDCDFHCLQDDSLLRLFFRGRSKYHYLSVKALIHFSKENFVNPAIACYNVLMINLILKWAGYNFIISTAMMFIAPRKTQYLVQLLAPQSIQIQLVYAASLPNIFSVTDLNEAIRFWICFFQEPFTVQLS